jgi:NADH:ubiquinone oxidoreductase subunit 5 (subunit L)/multisubunit Na+/H+ antiporter MnhA subunit
MMTEMLFLAILIPVAAGLTALVSGKRFGNFAAFTAVVATLANFAVALFLFGKTGEVLLPWAGFGIEFSLRLYPFSAFIVLVTAFFALLAVVYSTAFMKGKNFLNQYYAYLLLSVGLANGAALADNLIVLLFFWEGLLVTLFGMISIGNKNAFKTAIKALIIVGISDLVMMLGMGLTGHLAGTLAISKISLPLTGMLSNLAFLFLVIGATAKAGSMPFHSWIPDAAQDAPLPFMIILPTVIEKLLGIYLLARISLDMFKLVGHSWASIFLMTLGVITLLLAVLMAFVQKDMKKMLAYTSISQVGYMLLGIGTCLPVGIVGGLFHMINHVTYKCGLFMTAGSVEKEAGTTDLSRLGGLGWKMPITFGCFIITACAISGVPPFSGFFSKELIYDGALASGPIFYVIALIGSFLTAATFLKLGHAAFLGESSDTSVQAKEASWPMLVPSVLVAVISVLFGVFNAFPINKFILPMVSPEKLAGHHDFAGMPTNVMLVGLTLFVIAGALVHHMKAYKMSGAGLKVSDHIRNGLVFKGIYDKAEKRVFDPYDIGLKVASMVSKAAWWTDRKTDWVFDGLAAGVVKTASSAVRRSHTGNYTLYIVWAMVGTAAVIVFMLR